MSAPTHQPFNPKLVIGLILAGIAAFAALLLLLAFGGGPGGGSSRDGRAHALAVSAVGYKGLVSLVGQFHETYLIREPSDFGTENLVVIALEPTSRPEDLRRVLDQRMGRTTLIILPKWITMPDPARRGWVRAIAPGAGQMAARSLGGVAVSVTENARNGRTWAEGEDILTGFRMPVPASPQTISGGEVTPARPRSRRLGGQGRQRARRPARRAAALRPRRSRPRQQSRPRRCRRRRRRRWR